MEQPNNNGQASHTRYVFQSQRQKNALLKGYGIDQLIECGINYVTDDEQIKNGKLRQT